MYIFLVESVERKNKECFYKIFRSYYRIPVMVLYGFYYSKPQL